MHKSLVGLTAAAALGLAAVAAPVPANADCVGCAVGAGILGGVAAGALLSRARAGLLPCAGVWLCRACAGLLLGETPSLGRGLRLPLAHRASLSLMDLPAAR